MRNSLGQVIMLMFFSMMIISGCGSLIEGSVIHQEEKVIEINKNELGFSIKLPENTKDIESHSSGIQGDIEKNPFGKFQIGIYVDVAPKNNLEETDKLRQEVRKSIEDMYDNISSLDISGDEQIIAEYSVEDGDEKYDMIEYFEFANDATYRIVFEAWNGSISRYEQDIKNIMKSFSTKKMNSSTVLDCSHYPCKERNFTFIFQDCNFRRSKDCTTKNKGIENVTYVADKDMFFKSPYTEENYSIEHLLPTNISELQQMGVFPDQDEVPEEFEHYFSEDRISLVYLMSQMTYYTDIDITEDGEIILFTILGNIVVIEDIGEMTIYNINNYAPRDKHLLSGIYEKSNDGDKVAYIGSMKFEDNGSEFIIEEIRLEKNEKEIIFGPISGTRERIGSMKHEKEENIEFTIGDFHDNILLSHNDLVAQGNLVNINKESKGYSITNKGILDLTSTYRINESPESIRYAKSYIDRRLNIIQLPDERNVQFSQECRDNYIDDFYFKVSEEDISEVSEVTGDKFSVNFDDAQNKYYIENKYMRLYIKDGEYTFRNSLEIDKCIDDNLGQISDLEYISDPESPWYESIFIASEEGKHIRRIYEKDGKIKNEIFFISHHEFHDKLEPGSMSQGIRRVRYYNNSLIVMGEGVGLIKIVPE